MWVDIDDVRKEIKNLEREDRKGQDCFTDSIKELQG